MCPLHGLNLAEENLPVLLSAGAGPLGEPPGRKPACPGTTRCRSGKTPRRSQRPCSQYRSLVSCNQRPCCSGSTRSCCSPSAETSAAAGSALTGPLGCSEHFGSGSFVPGRFWDSEEMVADQLYPPGLHDSIVHPGVASVELH